MEARPALREWAVKLDAKPKYVVSSTRADFPWTNSHHITGDLRAGVQALKDATPGGVLLGSGRLASELDRLDLIDEYRLYVHPVLLGDGKRLLPGGNECQDFELTKLTRYANGVIATTYQRKNGADR